MTTATMNKFLHDLSIPKVEKDIENLWRAELRANIAGSAILSAHGSDGVLQTKTLLVLLEFKYSLDFTKRDDLIKPIIQCLMYLKKFEAHEERVPTTVFVGDNDECFMMPSAPLLKYLSREDIDWSKAPSEAYRELPNLFRELVVDKDINPYVLNLKERAFYFENVKDHLEAMSVGSVHRVPINIHNISGIYRSWEERVLNDKVDSKTAVSAFISTVLGNAYLHPRKKNVLICGDSEIRVHGDQHEAFFEWFQAEYRVTEKRRFTAIKDRLIEEESRRRDGDFYTPAVWAHEAHKMLEDELGPDWREEWAVWDCAAGTANLTRDYNFKDLHLSTLHQGDVNTINEMGYNAGAEIFQFDFLNDLMPGEEGLFDEPSKIPPKLKEALESGKKMVFLINPPFGTAAESERQGSNKAGAASTLVRSQMPEGMNGAFEQMYAQFMWRITDIVRRYNLDNAVLATYSTPLFLSGTKFENFRDLFHSAWGFKDGFLLQSNEFNGTSNSWGCSFTLWRKNEYHIEGHGAK